MISYRFFLIFSLAVLGMFLLPNSSYASHDPVCNVNCQNQNGNDLAVCNGLPAGPGRADCLTAADLSRQACTADCNADHSTPPVSETPEETPTAAPPAAPVPIPATSYSNIMSQGIIFAGICSGPAPAGGGDTCPCRARGDCTIDNIMQVFVNVATFILGISGSLVLLMFIYGGVMWLTSGGNEARVTKGKDILAGSLIGLMIIFGAYVAISVIISALKTGQLPTEGSTIESVSAP